MKRLVWIILFAAWAPYLLAAEATSTADPASGFRVTGVVAVGAQDWMVLVETEDGKYLRIRVGDELAAGEVLEIAPRWMRIAFPEGEQVWRLTPGERPVVKRDRRQTAGAGTDGTGQAPQMHEPVIRNVNAETMRAIDEAAKRSRKTAGTGASVGHELTVLLGPILEVEWPAEARVVLVNDMPPGPLQSVMEAIHNTLSGNHPVTLNVENSPGGPEQRVYVMPEAPAAQ